MTTRNNTKSLGLQDHEIATLRRYPWLLKEFVANLAAEDNKNTFFRPLRDDELPKQYHEVLEKWRRLAQAHQYTGPVAWHVRNGYSLKEHPLWWIKGDRYREVAIQYNWAFDLKYDEPTRLCIVFWIPRLLIGTTGLVTTQQRTVLEKTRKEYGLPEHHLSSFGSATLIAGLLYEYDKIDASWEYTVQTETLTDSRCAGGGFMNVYVDTQKWCKSNNTNPRTLYLASGASRGPNVGVFPLGIENLI